MLVGWWWMGTPCIPEAKIQDTTTSLATPPIRSIAIIDSLEGMQRN
jgi:hypothetical protein